MTQEEVKEFFADHTEFTINPLNEQFLFIAEVSLDLGSTTLHQYGRCLMKYRMTNNLTADQKELATRIYEAYIKDMILHEDDEYFMDEETICCGMQVRLPRLPLPRKYRGGYDLSQAAIQLELDRQHWALPYEKREQWTSAYIWTCRGCYRKALNKVVDTDKRGRFRAAAYTEFNMGYIKCIESNEAQRSAEEALMDSKAEAVVSTQPAAEVA